MSELPQDLQSAFLVSMGQPIPMDGFEIVQGDRWNLDGPAVVEVRFLGKQIFDGQSVRLSLKKPGKISLSDGSKVLAVKMYDDIELPRFARHLVEPNGNSLLIYNSYSVKRGDHSFEESWTGNAGVIVSPQSKTVRRYECSDGNGPFDRSNLVFEVEILPADAPWLPDEIYK